MKLRDRLSFLWTQRYNILLLVRADFAQNYLASYLGFAWAIIGPLVILGVLTSVFQFGFRLSPVSAGGAPFPLWLACGMIPWLYVADGLGTGVTSITSYAFLVRKAMFRIYLLPPIRIVSLGIIHSCLLVFLVLLLLFYELAPSLYWLQIFIYLPLLYLLLSGVALTLASLAVFVPDIISAMGIVVNLGFWATPVFWDPAMLPERLKWITIANPAYYIVRGYRDTFIGHRWIWERPLSENIVFALWLLGMLAIGMVTYKKLRPHFADVL